MPSPSDATTAPPAYAWDWVGRQRLVWSEARRRLAPAVTAAPAERPATRDATVRPADVPDWSDLLDRGPVRGATVSAAPGAGVDAATAVTAVPVDWAALATRAEVMAALRAAYPVDAVVRAAVDGAVADVAFLGRRGGDLAVLGVRTPPRGLRWWWAHLGGDLEAEPTEPVGTPARPAGVQLTLVDVMTGYGDPVPVG